MTSLVVPDTFAATLDAGILSRLEEHLCPPVEERARDRFEIEVEVVGEGTFTIAVEGGRATGRKGFARGEPLVSVKIPKGGWALLRKELQAAVDGFPQNPELHRRLLAVKAMRCADLEAVLKGIQRMKSLGLAFDVKGHGLYEAARGSLDEVTRKLTLILDGAAIDRVLAGESPDALRAEVKGDRGVGTEILAALGPVLVRLKTPR